MEPIAIGLMCSGVYAVAQGAINGVLSAALALTTLLLIMLTRINTMVLILSAGVLGGALMIVFGWR
jgi:chromate transporter